MKTSLKNVASEAAKTPDAVALAEVEESTAVAPADVSSLMTVGAVTGSVSPRDLLIPRLSIVQSVGHLSEVFTPGDIVLNNEVRLMAYNKEKVSVLECLVLSIAKSYEERLPYSPTGPWPQKFKTLEEVLAAGLTLDWVKGKPEPTAREVAETLILLKKPKDVECVSFSYTLGNAEYALAVWTLRSTAYSRAAKKIFSAAAIELHKTGLESGKWTLSTSREQINGNWIFVPVLRLTGTNTPEMCQQIKALLRR